MQINNFEMKKDKEGMNQITFIVENREQQFSVIVKETINGASGCVLVDGKKKDIDDITSDWPDNEYEQISEYIQAQCEMVHNFNH